MSKYRVRFVIQREVDVWMNSVSREALTEWLDENPLTITDLNEYGQDRHEDIVMYRIIEETDDETSTSSL